MGLPSLARPAPAAARPVPPPSRLPLHLIQLPPGYRIDAFAENVESARSLAQRPSGIVDVGTRRAGMVHALRDVDGDGPAPAYETFAEGWLQGEEAWGWPVDLMFLPDGSLLVSDDQADAVDRISRGIPGAH